VSGLLYTTSQRHGVRQPKAPRQLLRGQPARQLDQGERVATGLCDDPISHPLVHWPCERRIQQRPSVRLRQAVHDQLGQPSEDSSVTAVAHREHERDALGQQSPSHKRQRLRGNLI
jgi:hypothetical protein